MAKKSTVFRSICSVLFSGLIGFSFSSFVPSLADEVQANTAAVSSPIGRQCTEDPACAVVGNTHMLQWKSDGSARVFVVCIHGLGLCARAYKSLAKEFSNAGIDGCAINVRGFGPDRLDKSYSKLDLLEASADLKELLLALRRSHPGHRLCLLGESMGAALAIRVTADNPELVDDLVCSTPAWKLLKLKTTAVKGVLEVFLNSGGHSGLVGRSVVKQATSDPNLTEHLLSDPSHKLRLSANEVASFLRFISKTKKAASHIGIPVLFVQGLNDRLVPPPAVARLFSQVPAQEKQFIVDAQGEHLLLEEGQISPVLLQSLIQWLKRTTVAPNDTRNLFVVVNDCPVATDKKRLERLRGLCKHATIYNGLKPRNRQAAP